MNNQAQKAKEFHSLHKKGEPVILFNIWDAGSALAVEYAGAKAIATGSHSVAEANGFQDGQDMPMDLALANIERIVKTVNVPVTLDFEGGYATDLDTLKANVRRVIATGAIGINFEDQVVGGKGLYPVEEQWSRIAAIREVADDAGVPLFINARTDVFLKTYPAEHTREQLDEVLTRGQFDRQMDDVLMTLTEREEKVLRLRFGIGDGYPRTLEEVGQIFNVTRERVRQIEAKALRKLRHPTRSRKLKNFLDVKLSD